MKHCKVVIFMQISNVKLCYIDTFHYLHSYVVTIIKFVFCLRAAGLSSKGVYTSRGRVVTKKSNYLLVIHYIYLL